MGGGFVHGVVGGSMVRSTDTAKGAARARWRKSGRKTNRNKRLIVWRPFKRQFHLFPLEGFTSRYRYMSLNLVKRRLTF